MNLFVPCSLKPCILFRVKALTFNSSKNTLNVILLASNLMIFHWANQNTQKCSSLKLIFGLSKFWQHSSFIGFWTSSSSLVLLYLEGHDLCDFHHLLCISPSQMSREVGGGSRMTCVAFVDAATNRLPTVAFQSVPAQLSKTCCQRKSKKKKHLFTEIAEADEMQH